MSQSLALDQMGHPVHLGQGNARQSIYALHEPPIQAKKMNLGGNLRGDGFQVKRRVIESRGLLQEPLLLHAVDCSIKKKSVF